jgi:hypothetical protein
MSLADESDDDAGAGPVADPFTIAQQRSGPWLLLNAINADFGRLCGARGHSDEELASLR